MSCPGLARPRAPGVPLASLSLVALALLAGALLPVQAALNAQLARSLRSVPLAALVLYATAPGWWLMVAGGIVVGMGIGLVDAGINTAVAQQAAAARLIGPLHGFYGLGAFAGPAIATTVLALGGSWRLVYGVLAVGVGLLVVVVWRQRRAGLWPTAHVSAAGEGPGLLLALRSSAVGLSSLVLLGAVGLEASIGTWAYSVENLGRAQPALAAGLGVSLYWLGLTLGRQDSLEVKQSSVAGMVLAIPAVPAVQGCHGPGRPGPP